MTQSLITGVLFDIDGTIMHARHAGKKSFSDAMERVFGWVDNLDHIQFAGNTDLRIIREIMRVRGARCTEEQRQQLYETMADRLAHYIGDSDAILYPGVRALLEALAPMEHVRTGLVTGNIETCALIKVGHFGLDEHFPLGGFGDEHHDRVELARLAISRMEESLANGQKIDRMFLIGDTPSDIRAARETGMTSIAVATGIYDVDALRDAGADTVLEDLSDLDAVLKILGV